MPRPPKSIKSAEQILKGSNHILHSLYAQSRQLLEIETIAKRVITEDFAVASLNNGRLLLTTPKSTIATRLRYRQQYIITSLRGAGLDVRSLHIKVRPELEPPRPAQRERFLSPDSARHLARTAQYIDDEPLRNALINLSKRCR